MTNTLLPDALTPTALSRPFVGRLSETPFLQGPGEQTTFLLSESVTGGAVAAGQIVVEANSGPPPHVHSDAEELFLVQSGAFEILANGELIEARAGDVAYLARGEAHRFRGLDSGEENRFSILIAPGDFEHFMKRWVTLFETGAPDMQQAIALCGEYNISLYHSDELAPAVPAAPQTRVITAANAPTPIEVEGTKVTLLLTASQTGGRYSLIRVDGPRDAGPPPHFHSREDELFIIEAGEVEITLGDEKFVAVEGDMVWAPRGVLHTFRIHSERARMAVFMTPGGFEGFLQESAEIEIAGNVQPAVMMALGAKYDLSFPMPSA